MIIRHTIKFCFRVCLAFTVLGVGQWAYATGPITEGLAGAMRSGIENEAALGNPAALGILNQSLVRAYYGKSRFADRDSGGRNLSFGVYDGQNPNAHAGIEYFRESRAAAHRGGLLYRDRNEIRLGAGRALFGGVLGGLNIKHVTVRDGGPEDRFVDIDAGILFHLASDLRVGVLAQNLSKNDRQDPATLGLGLRYALGSGVVLRADGGKLTRGDRMGEKFWAGALEVVALGDLVLRTGLFNDPHAEARGQSFGLGWASPRSVFDYSYMRSKSNPKDRRHTLGLTIFI